MQESSRKTNKTRMIHIRLLEDIHRSVRIRAAESDSTIQDWVVAALRNELARKTKHKGARNE